MIIEDRIEELRALPAAPMALDAAGYCAAWELVARHRNEDGSPTGNIPGLTVVPEPLYDQAKSIIGPIFFDKEPGPRPDHPMRGATDLQWHAALSDQPRRWYMIGHRAAFAFECPQ